MLSSCKGYFENKLFGYSIPLIFGSQEGTLDGPCSPKCVSIFQHRGPLGVREDAGSLASLPVYLHVQPVHEELQKLLSILLAGKREGSAILKKQWQRTV